MNLHVKQTKAPSEARNALPFAGKINGVIMPMGMERDEFTLFAQALADSKPSIH